MGSSVSSAEKYFLRIVPAIHKLVSAEPYKISSFTPLGKNWEGGRRTFHAFEDFARVCYDIGRCLVDALCERASHLLAS